MVPDDQFWDIQTLRRSHVRRLHSDTALTCRLGPDAPSTPVGLHLLFHEAGLGLIRLTAPLPAEATAAVTPAGLGTFSDSVWAHRGMQWTSRLTGVPRELHVDVRSLMDHVMLPLIEALTGRSDRTAPVDQSPEARSRWLEGLVADGKILSPYPVTFGTAYELLWPGAAELHRASPLAAELANGGEGTTSPAEVSPLHTWHLSENRSVLALCGAGDVSPLGTYDPLRTQVLEYLNLQRAALRGVQRSTQLAITERREVSRRDLQHWQRLVAALTDEYVLHDQVAAVVGPLRAHLKHQSTTRDPTELEAQVRQNLGVFQGAIDAATDRVAVILSVLFGVVAALSLAPLFKKLQLALFSTPGTPDNFDDRHLGLSIAIDLLLLVALILAALTLVRAATRVRPPR